MARKSKTSPPYLLFSLVIILVVAIVLTIFNKKILNGPGSTQSQASRSTYLTPGDDVFSLEQDLSKLSIDESDKYWADLEKNK